VEAVKLENKLRRGWKKVLANLWTRRKIQKRPALVVGQKPDGKLEQHFNRLNNTVTMRHAERFIIFNPAVWGR